MKLRPQNGSLNAALRRRRQDGSILVVVLWVVFGLIAVTLYFAHSMTMELRASDNRVAGIEAEQAIEGGRRYITCVLSNVNSAGALPDPLTYANQAVAVGDAKFWLIGRGYGSDAATLAHFGLIDEASKINLNMSNGAMLSNLLFNIPRMTPDLIANILAWRSTNTTSRSGGAESDTYNGLPQPYNCKNGAFETVDELRLIYNMDMTTLYGEDANLNGILDPNENDGDVLPPSDNMNGQLEPGLFEFVTIYNHEPNTFTNMGSSGTMTNTARFNITTYTAANETQLVDIFVTNGVASDRARQIVQGAAGGPFSSPLAFYYAASQGSGKMTTAEFMQIENSIRGSNIVGLININTASQTVLNAIPAWQNGQAQQVVSYRPTVTNQVGLNTSVIWLTQVLSQQDALNAAPYLTGKSYQYTADIAAVGHNGRGYRRTRFVFDTSSGSPVIVYRRDLSNLGWALGKEAREKYLLGKNTL